MIGTTGGLRDALIIDSTEGPRNALMIGATEGHRDASKVGATGGPRDAPAIGAKEGPKDDLSCRVLIGRSVGNVLLLWGLFNGSSIATSRGFRVGCRELLEGAH